MKSLKSFPLASLHLSLPSEMAEKIQFIIIYLKPSEFKACDNLDVNTPYLQNNNFKISIFFQNSIYL